MRVARAAFWGSAAVLVYTYVGFPALVLARPAVRQRPLRPDPSATPPTVTVLVAAHDEEAAIAEKVRNVLAQSPSVAGIQLIVASDGSTDGTVRAASGVDDPRVTVLDLPRGGKAAALNAGLDRATGDVVVFTDANSMLADHALAHLLAPFADPEVGGVAGDQRYLADDGTASGERAYWDLDRRLKVAQSRTGSITSATGALYAVRRELIGTVPDGVTDDFAVSTGVVDCGRRLVFAPGAVVHEPPATALSGEYRRKVRVMTRGLRGVALRSRLLDPRRTGFYALQLGSSKLLRRLSVFALLTSSASAGALRRDGPTYAVAAGGQAALLAGSGACLVLARTRLGRRRFVALPAYFAMVNVAALHASWNVLTGRRIDRWATQRAAT